MKLSTGQIDEFNNRGVIIARDALTHDDQQPLIDELSTWIEERAQVLHAEGKLTDLHKDAPFATRYGLLFQQYREIGQGMDIMQMRGPATFDFLRNRNLLDAVESLVGPEITCNPIQHVRAKPPSNFGHSSWSHGVPWHQDAAVMMKEATESNVITCWLPLSVSTV